MQDLTLFTFLALWREFARTGKKIWWLTPQTCLQENGSLRLVDFIASVLKPAKNNDNIQGEQ